MRNLCCALASLGIVVALSCGGGSSDGGTTDGGGGSTSLVGSFSASQANPGDNSVAMAEGSGTNGNLVVVEVNVTGTSNLFGAAFDVTYDSSRATFVNWSPGTVLESGGQSVSYQVSATQPGLVVIGISRTGSQAGGVDVTAAQPAIRLTFRVTQAGNSTLGFGNASLQDAQSPPQDIPGLSWYGGTLVAN